MPLRRSRKMLHETDCLNCWLQEKPCSVGTLIGNCIPCGNSEPVKPLVPFDGFFTKDMSEHLISLGTKHDLDLSSEGDVLSFATIEPNGWANSLQLQLRGDFSLSNDDLRTQLDQIVLSYYVPRISYRIPRANLPRSALYARGYLSILLPRNLAQETMTFSDSFRLSNVILGRLDKSIEEVTNAADADKSQDDEASKYEVSAAVTILYTGLADAYKRLQNGDGIPLCGGEKMASLLTERMKSTLNYLTFILYRRGINCNRKWASNLDGSLENLRSNVEISTLSITTVKQTRLTYASTLSATISSSVALPPPSTDEPTFKGIHASTAHLSPGNSWNFDDIASSPAPHIEGSTSPEVDSQPSTTFDLSPPPPLNRAKSAPHFLLSSSLPLGDASLDLQRMSKEITAQASVDHRYFNPCNSWLMQSMTRDVNPEPVYSYNDNLLPPARPQQRNFLPEMPSYVSAASAFYALAGTPGEVASQISVPSGPNSRTNWSEHPHTWRQS